METMQFPLVLAAAGKVPVLLILSLLFGAIIIVLFF